MKSNGAIDEMNLELSNNGNVIDSKRVIIPQTTDDLYIYSTDIGSAEDVEVINIAWNDHIKLI